MGFGGFMKGLGKGLLKAAPFASMAIPFIGPAIGMSALGATGAAGAMGGAGKLGSILGAAGKIGGAVAPILGGAAKGRAEGRQQEEVNNLARDKFNQQADLLNLQAPETRMQNVAKSNLMGQQPVSLNWGGPGSGMRGKSLQARGGFMERDPRMAQMANKVMGDELMAQMSGKPAFAQATAAPESGFIDKALGVGSFTGGILGALNTLKKPSARPPVQVGGGDPYSNTDLLKPSIKFGEF